MKLVMFNVKKRKEFENKRPKFNIEKLLFLGFIMVFLVLILVQAALTSPTLRTFLVTDDKYEGTPLGVEETIYEEGKIELDLTSGNCSPDIKILVNGEEIADFTKSHIGLTVKNGDIVEIDDSIAKVNIEVAISSISTNINQNGLNRVTSISKGINRIAIIKLINKNS